jgi:MerR family transcriptional regulator/heat shock protein HspR
MTDNEENRTAENEPFFVISIAARLVNVHQQTLRYYERLGLLEPGRSKGNIRLYSMKDVHRAQQIRRLIDELGVNLAGVEVILNMSDRMADAALLPPLTVYALGRRRGAARRRTRP